MKTTQGPTPATTNRRGRRRLAPLPLAPRLLWLLAAFTAGLPAQADESLLNYLVGVETQPKDSSEIYQWITQRSGKGLGQYEGTDYRTELEHGFTDRFAASLYINAQGINTHGIRVDAYIPEDVSYGLVFSGISAAFKYNFLSPYRHAIGLSLYVEPTVGTKDPHSGLEKRTYSLETMLLLQKNFRDDTVLWVNNFSLESTYAHRAALDPAALASLPADFDWPVVPEMEIEPSIGSGVSFRVASNWYVGLETIYQAEFETEVGKERWSWFAGPTFHYGARKWWATLSWFGQVEGGGERVPGQSDSRLQLVEKTKDEWRMKIGLNF